MRYLALLLSLISCAAFAGRVSVVPTSAFVPVDGTVDFSAYVAGTTDQQVDWRIEELNGGMTIYGVIDPVTGVYTAPSAIPVEARIRVVATSHQDATRKAYALIVLGPKQVRVSVTPESAAVAPNASQQFVAVAENSDSSAVQWRVNGLIGGNKDLGFITQSGLYTAPAFVIPRVPVVVISAVSKRDPSAVGTARARLATPNRFVATNGDDANDGSESAPWRHIQHAADVANPGDVIQIGGGIYNERVLVRRSGTDTPQRTISFIGAPGEHAIIDGAGLLVGFDDTALFAVQASWIVVANLELRNYVSHNARVPIGIVVDNGAEPFAHVGEVAVIGNHVHDIVTTGGTCASGGNAKGIAVHGRNGQDGIIAYVTGNEVDHLTTGCSESMTFSGNVYFWANDNIVHDVNNIGIDATGGYADLPGSANGEMQRNVVYNVSSFYNPAYGANYAAGGIYVDGGTQILMTRNVVRNADIGIELASENQGHVTSLVTASDNLVYRSTGPGLSIGGAGANNGGTTDCKIVNNTLFQNDVLRRFAGEVQVQFNAAGNVFKNNLLFANNRGVFIVNHNTDSPAALDADYNLYWSAGASEWEWNRADLVGFDAWRAATGFDAHSMYANPLIGSAVVPVLRPRAGSPAVDAGIDLGAAVQGNRDVYGVPRVHGAAIDIGAYEQ